MTSGSKSIGIVGGGVIGLSLAWLLAREGCNVSVFERDRCARHASWAAAGMLAAATETTPGEEAFFALGVASRQMWPGFAKDLEAATGMSIGLQSCGIITGAHSQAHASQLQQTAKMLSAMGERVRILSAEQAREKEPQLADDILLAFYSHDDGQVDNRLFGDALLIACARAGVDIREGTSVQDVVLSGGFATGLMVDGETYAFDRIVLAAGPWSSSSFPSLEGKLPRVFPVKGQMLAFESDAEFNHVIWGDGIYIVPREDGRVIIGATVEDAGFDISVDEATIKRQVERAAAVVPALEDADVVDTWAGLRPQTDDGLPLIGETEVPNLVMATGHYRNGILLAPVTAMLLTRLLCEGDVPPALLPFLPTRFAAQ